jgi:hypothetical protein
MAKQNVFNFKTMQFELVECYDLLSLIDDLNAECAAQQNMHLTGGGLPAKKALSKPEVSSAPKQNLVPPTRK